MQKKKEVKGNAPRRKVPRRTAMRSAEDDQTLRKHLVTLLEGGQAHADLQHAFAELPAGQHGIKPAGSPHTAWQLLEHLRIAQWDILEFSRNPKHVSPRFPEGYWPSSEAPPNPQAWNQSLSAVERDLAEMKKLVSDPRTNLSARIPHGSGQTILREAFLVADHNAYHLGQIVLLRRLLGTWSRHK